MALLDNSIEPEKKVIKKSKSLTFEERDPLLFEWPQPLKYRRIETEEDIKSEIQDMTWPENRPPNERFTKSQSMPNIRLRRSKSKQDNFEDPDCFLSTQTKNAVCWKRLKLVWNQK